MKNSILLLIGMSVSFIGVLLGIAGTGFALMVCFNGPRTETLRIPLMVNSVQWQTVLVEFAILMLVSIFFLVVFYRRFTNAGMLNYEARLDRHVKPQRGKLHQVDM